MRAIQAVAFNHPTELFYNSTINVGQEDLLAKELEKHRLLPKVSSKAFCYHYKSITVKVTDEVKTLHKKKKTNNKDLRDNLLYFHSETGRKNGKASVSYNSRVHSSIKTQNSMWAKHANSVEIYPSQSAPSTAGSPVSFTFLKVIAKPLWQPQSQITRTRDQTTLSGYPVCIFRGHFHAVRMAIFMHFFVSVDNAHLGRLKARKNLVFGQLGLIDLSVRYLLQSTLKLA